jgi:hypothetical protein
MVVSAEHVRKLWSALHDLEANVESLAPATGSAPPTLVEVCHHYPNPTRNG